MPITEKPQYPSFELHPDETHLQVAQAEAAIFSDAVAQLADNLSAGVRDEIAAGERFHITANGFILGTDREKVLDGQAAVYAERAMDYVTELFKGSSVASYKPADFRQLDSSINAIEIAADRAVPQWEPPVFPADSLALQTILEDGPSVEVPDEAAVEQFADSETARFLADMTRLPALLPNAERQLRGQARELIRQRKGKQKSATEKAQKRSNRMESHMWPWTGPNELYTEEGALRREIAMLDLRIAASSSIADAISTLRLQHAFAAKNGREIAEALERCGQGTDRLQIGERIRPEIAAMQVPIPAQPSAELLGACAAAMVRDNVSPASVAQSLHAAARAELAGTRIDIGRALEDTTRSKGVEDERMVVDITTDSIQSRIENLDLRMEQVLKVVPQPKTFIFHASESGLPIDAERLGASVMYVPDDQALRDYMVVMNLYEYSSPKDLKFYEAGRALLDEQGPDGGGFYQNPARHQPPVRRGNSVLDGAKDGPDLLDVPGPFGVSLNGSEAAATAG